MNQPVEIFNRVGSFVHQIPVDPAKPEIIGVSYSDNITSFPPHMPSVETVNGEASVTLTCVTAASAYSTLAPGDSSKCVNYILLRHDLEFNPVFSEHASRAGSWILDGVLQGATACQSYRVRVRPLNAAGQKALNEGDTGLLNPWEDPWTDNFTETEALLLPNSQPQNMPEMVTNSQSHGTVTSGSINAGFFGDDPTGGIGGSISVSETTTVSYSTPTMESQDQSTDDHVLNKLFVTHPNVDGSDGIDDPSRNPGRFSFGTSIAEIFEVPDDKHGLRDGKTTMRAFEISISASIPINFPVSKEVGMIRDIFYHNGSIARVDGGSALSTSYSTFPTTVTTSTLHRHIIQVPAPPLPSGVLGLDYPNEYNDPSKGPSKPPKAGGDKN